MCNFANPIQELRGKLYDIMCNINHVDTFYEIRRLLIQEYEFLLRGRSRSTFEYPS